MAAGGWYPPVNVLDSLSRLMPAVTTPGHRTRAAKVRRLLAAYARSEDLVRIGAYKEGTDNDLDRAIRAMPLLREFLEQQSHERVTLEETVARLNAMEL
jgi:flagellum-specific ATP synthase